MMESLLLSTPGGVLHVRSIGVGEPVLLLHGFPDSSLGFVDLCEALAARGFRALAPDLRGYGLSDKPAGLEPYRSSALVADLAALIAALGLPRVNVVGHDWGGTLAFCLAEQHPELVTKLVVMNAPHPGSYVRILTRSLQLLRGWYILFFQLRRFAEWVVTRGVIFRWMLRQLVAQRGRLTPTLLEARRRELLRPGSARAALSYYRAAVRWPIRCPSRIHTPTLILWGERDPSLDLRLLDDLPERIENVTVVRLPEAGHFVHWDEPERVVSELVAFIR